MDDYDENESQIPSTPSRGPVFHSDTVYQSGNPSQYRNPGEKSSDTDEYDDPSFLPSDEEEGKNFVDDFPSQLTDALLPLEAAQKQEKQRGKKTKKHKKRRREESSEEEEGYGSFKDEFPSDLPARPANFLWPDALPKEKEKRDRPYKGINIYPLRRPNPYDAILPTELREKKNSKYNPKEIATPIRPKIRQKIRKRQKKGDDESSCSDDESLDIEKKVADETWLNYNADEIELIDSLNVKEAQDLGAQLVNVVGLKRSRWDFEKMMAGKVKDWHNKRRWQRDVQDSEEARQAFERDDIWGAWPLEPWNVPREGEKDTVDEFRWREKRSSMHAMIISEDHYKPSREMEEVLTARGLKMAKERFQGREWKARDEITSDMEREELQEFRESAIEMGLDPDEELERLKNEYNDIAETEEAERTRFRWLRDRREPTVDADDDRNKARMRVPVRHALARLDDLLLAMRKNRKAGDEFLAAKTGSQSASRMPSVASGYATDTADGKPSSMSGRKCSGQKSKTKDISGRARNLQDISEYKDKYTTEKIKGKRGRPKKVPIPQPGETQEEAIIRMHKQMKRKIPVFNGKNAAVAQKIKDEPLDEDVMIAECDNMDDANTTKGGNTSPELIGHLEEQTMLEEAAASQTQKYGTESPELIGTLEEQIMLEEAAASQASQNYQELDQDNAKQSYSGDPAQEEYIASQYGNRLYSKEMWADRMKRRRAKKEAEEAEHKEWMMRYANRDWSDVLGMAAIIGFPPKVIQRTAQRLTLLLGEGIDLRVFQRLPDREASTLVRYRPEKIPINDGLFESSERESIEQDYNSDNEDLEDSLVSASSPNRSMSSIRHVNKRKANQDSDISLSSSGESSFFSESESEGHTCPILNCDRQVPGRKISTRKALRAHLRKKHDWSEHDIENFYEEISNEDEMLGGILRNGFLKKIKSHDAYDRRSKKEESSAVEAKKE